MFRQPDVILVFISGFCVLWDAIALSRVNKRAAKLLTVKQESVARRLPKGLVCWVHTDGGVWRKGIPSNSFEFNNASLVRRGIVFTCFSDGNLTDRCDGQFIGYIDFGKRVSVRVKPPYVTRPLWYNLSSATPFGAFPLLLDSTGRFYAGASGKAGTECAGKPQYCPPSNFVVIMKLPLEIRESEVGTVIDFAPFVSEAHVEHARQLEIMDPDRVSFDIGCKLDQEFIRVYNSKCPKHDINEQLRRFLESREVVITSVLHMRCGCRFSV